MFNLFPVYSPNPVNMGGFNRVAVPQKENRKENGSSHSRTYSVHFYTPSSLHPCAHYTCRRRASARIRSRQTCNIFTEFFYIHRLFTKNSELARPSAGRSCAPRVRATLSRACGLGLVESRTPNNIVNLSQSRPGLCRLLVSEPLFCFFPFEPAHRGLRWPGLSTRSTYEHFVTMSQGVGSSAIRRRRVVAQFALGFGRRDI